MTLPALSTDAQYGIRFAPRTLDTAYGRAIRDTLRAPNPGYGIRTRNTGYASRPNPLDTEYAIHNTGCAGHPNLWHRPKPNTDTQYALRSSGHPSRRCHERAPRIRNYSIRHNPQTHNIGGEATEITAKYRIRNTVGPSNSFILCQPVTNELRVSHRIRDAPVNPKPHV